MSVPKSQTKPVFANRGHGSEAMSSWCWVWMAGGYGLKRTLLWSCKFPEPWEEVYAWRNTKVGPLELSNMRATSHA